MSLKYRIETRYEIKSQDFQECHEPRIFLPNLFVVSLLSCLCISSAIKMFFIHSCINLPIHERGSLNASDANRYKCLRAARICAASPGSVGSAPDAGRREAWSRDVITPISGRRAQPLSATSLQQPLLSNIIIHI